MSAGFSALHYLGKVLRSLRHEGEKLGVWCIVSTFHLWYPLVNIQKAMENGHL